MSNHPDNLADCPTCFEQSRGPDHDPAKWVALAQHTLQNEHACIYYGYPPQGIGADAATLARAVLSLKLALDVADLASKAFSSEGRDD